MFKRARPIRPRTAPVPPATFATVPRPHCPPPTLTPPPDDAPPPQAAPAATVDPTKEKVSPPPSQPRAVHPSSQPALSTPPRRPNLPGSLKALGQDAAWSTLYQVVHEQLCARCTQPATVMLHGGCGIGKTHGVMECAKSFSLQVYTVDMAETASSSELCAHLKEIATTKTMEGTSLLLLDNAEAFSGEYATHVVHFLRTARRPCPTIVVVNNLFSLQMKPFRAAATHVIRIPTPTWVACMQLAKATFGAHTIQSVLEAQARACNGDLRQLRLCHMRLKSARDTGAIGGIFECTRAFLQGTRTSDEWAQCDTESSRHRILHQNYPLLIAETDNMEQLARLADAFSLHQHGVIDVGTVGECVRLSPARPNAALKLSAEYASSLRFDRDTR